MLVACSAFRTLTPVHVCMCDLFTLNLSAGFLMYSFHDGTRMVKDGEDWHGLQTANLENLDTLFKMRTKHLYLCLTVSKANNSLVFLCH